jgi:hypothetical protein
MSVANTNDKEKTTYQKWYEKNKEKNREYKRENMRRYRSENPEKYRKQSRDAKKRLKESVFDIYGRICKRCGFTDIRALTLDHIKNNGNKERKEIGERGVYYRSLDSKFHSEYQTLCMNCQFIKRYEHDGDWNKKR